MLNTLSNRERYAVYAAIGFIVFFVLVRFLTMPFFEKKERLKRSVIAKVHIIDEMRGLKKEYERIYNQQAALAKRVDKRPPGFTLFSFLETLSGQAGLKNRISYMKPSTLSPKDSPYKVSRVEMKLKGVTMAQLIAYLYRVETSPNMVTVRRISISKEAKDQGAVTVVMQVETLAS